MAYGINTTIADYIQFNLYQSLHLTNIVTDLI